MAMSKNQNVYHDGGQTVVDHAAMRKFPPALACELHPGKILAPKLSG
jgi:hypothetical protein